MSFDVILPFLRPIEDLIRDAQISEIMVNGAGSVFVEREGRLTAVEGVRLEERNLQVAVRNIARSLGDEIGEEKPLLDSRLPDGSRVAAVFAPLSVEGTILTIRKFRHRRFDLQELEEIGTLTPGQRRCLQRSVFSRRNLLISGGTGAGKTTLLNALLDIVPQSERLVLIEDTAEIRLSHPNRVRLEARREQPHLPAVTIRELVRAALRHRPDRLILGEVRGGEAFDLLQALNTGHSGSVSTIHADSARRALSRFTTCVLQSGVELPYPAVRSAIADSIALIAHVERRRGKRVLSELSRLDGYDPRADRFRLRPALGKRGDQPRSP